VSCKSRTDVADIAFNIINIIEIWSVLGDMLFSHILLCLLVVMFVAMLLSDLRATGVQCHEVYDVLSRLSTSVSTRHGDTSGLTDSDFTMCCQ